jgi:hypothetical protein
VISTRLLIFAGLAISCAAAIPAAAAADDKETDPTQENSPAEPASAPAESLTSATPPTSQNSSSPPTNPVGSRKHPQIIRTSVPRLNYQPDSENLVERAENDISSAIVVGFGNELAIAWDTSECRWLYAWRGGFIERIESEVDSDSESTSDFETTTDIVGELIYLSTGPSPLSLAMGAAGGPHYFGHRMVEGVPEFLYTIGKLKVSERIFPSDDGTSIIQKFSVERHPVDLILAAPLSVGQKSDNDAAITVTNGTLKGDLIYVDEKKAGDFTLSHRIGGTLPLPGAAKPLPVARPVALPLLTQTDSTKAKPEIMPAAKSAPEVGPVPDPTPTPKPNTDTPPSLKEESKPAPAPPEKSAPIITKAQRYDRDILLTDPHIETGSLKTESTAFADRDFKFTQLPEEVIGADHVRTFDRDKYIPGDILSYQVELDRDATVWLMFDKRVNPLPKWIGKNFSSTGKIAVLDSGETFQVLRAEVDAGKLRLGPQDSGAGAHFYVIAAMAREADTPKGSPKSKTGKPESE